MLFPFRLNYCNKYVCICEGLVITLLFIFQYFWNAEFHELFLSLTIDHPVKLLITFCAATYFMKCFPDG